MALFNKINRRIKSMQQGGQPFGGNVVMPEVDDGSIGGFNRPELRGLRKQARRGTLTNRERRRLNYLTNEVKGRRRRGLLSGLGGAAAALGTAALIKSGGAKGLMDSIKSRISGEKGQEKLDAFNEANRLKNQQALDAQLESGEIDQTTYDRQTAELAGAEGVTSTRDLRRIQKGKAPRGFETTPSGEPLPDSMTTMDEIMAGESDGKGKPITESGPISEIVEEEEQFPDEPTGEQLGKEAAAMRQLMAEQDLEESDRLTEEEQLQEATREADKLSAIEEAKAAGSYKKVAPPRGGGAPEEEFAEGTSTEDMLNALQNAETPEEQQRILDKMGVVKGGGGMTLEEAQKDIQLRQQLEQGRGAPSAPESVVPDTPGQGEEVKFPEAGAEPDDADLEEARRLLMELNRGDDIQRLEPLKAGPIDRPEDPFAGQLPVTRAQELLKPFMPSGRTGSSGQQSGGVDITMPDGSDAPPGASTSRSTAEKQMKPGQVIRGYRTKDGQIVYYPADSGKTTQAVGGMVKRLMNRYR